MTASPDGSCVLPAAGRDWHFKLTIGQWMKLQKAFGNIGPAKIFSYLASDDWKVEDTREVIERGLEGGGMETAQAREQATEIMNAQPLKQNMELATDIIGAGWEGMEELLKKKASIAAMTQALSKTQTGNGGSATSSVPLSSSKSSRPKSRASVSGNISR